MTLHSKTPPPRSRPSTPQSESCVRVMQQIEQAVRTLRLLPKVQLHGALTYWPPVIQSYWDAYGAEPERMHLRPTPQQISQLDQVCEWLTWLDTISARIVWARARRQSWRKIAYSVGHLSHVTCRERFRIAIVTIAYKEAVKKDFTNLTKSG